MKPLIDYIQIIVPGIQAADPFYSRLKELLFATAEIRISVRVEEHDFDVFE